VIPIIYVLAEDDYFGIELLEVTVGRGTTGAAFGSKQLHQHRQPHGIRRHDRQDDTRCSDQ
jgi:hypothetical protein